MRTIPSISSAIASYCLFGSPAIHGFSAVGQTWFRAVGAGGVVGRSDVEHTGYSSWRSW